MLGECVISSVLSHQSKNLKWRTSVIAWLQLRVLAGKQQRKVHPQGVRAGWPQRRGLSPSWLPRFIPLSPPPPWACSMQIRLFVSPKVLTLVLGFSLAPFSQAFLLFCLYPPPFWTPFSYSKYLMLSHKVWKGYQVLMLSFKYLKQSYTLTWILVPHARKHYFLWNQKGVQDSSVHF